MLMYPCFTFSTYIPMHMPYPFLVLPLFHIPYLPLYYTSNSRHSSPNHQTSSPHVFLTTCLSSPTTYLFLTTQYLFLTRHTSNPTTCLFFPAPYLFPTAYLFLSPYLSLCVQCRYERTL